MSCELHGRAEPGAVRQAPDGAELARILLARKLASVTASLSSEEQDGLSRDVWQALSRFTDSEIVRIRAAMTAALEALPGTPPELMQGLSDEAWPPLADAVSRVLPLLTTDDLLRLVAASPDSAVGEALALRGESAFDAGKEIAASASSKAIASLLANPAAAIREAALDVLASTASKPERGREPSASGAALPQAAVSALAELVSAPVCEMLKRDPTLPPAFVAELCLALQRDQAGVGSRRDPCGAEAYKTACALAGAGLIDEQSVLAAARRGEARLAAAQLALAADVDLAVIDRICRLRAAKGLVSVVWKAGFSADAASPLQALLTRLPPHDILAPRPGGAYPLSEEEMLWHIAFLTRTEPSEAGAAG